MLKIKKLPATVYPAYIRVAVTDSWEEVNKKFNSNKSDEVAATVLVITEGNIVIVFKRDCFKLKYIAHEIVHAVNEVFRYSNVELDLNNDEPQAYLTSWLFEQVYKFCEREGLVK